MTMRSFHFGSVLLLLSISRIHGFSPTLTSKRHQRNCNAQISSRGPVYYSSLQTSLGYIDNTMDRPSDFAKRMRSNVTPTKVPKKVSPGRPNNVVEVVTLQDYKTIVADEKDQMVVVRFYAPWCRVSFEWCLLSVPLSPDSYHLATRTVHPWLFVFGQFHLVRGEFHSFEKATIFV